MINFMDAVFYLLLLFNFGIGVFCLIFLLAATMEPPDPSVKTIPGRVVPPEIPHGRSHPRA